MDNERIAIIETRLDGIDRQLAEIKSAASNNTRTIIGTVIVSMFALAGIIVAIAAIQDSWVRQSIAQSNENMVARLEASRQDMDRVTAARLEKMDQLIVRIDEDARRANELAVQAKIDLEVSQRTANIYGGWLSDIVRHLGLGGIGGFPEDDKMPKKK